MCVHFVHRTRDHWKLVVVHNSPDYNQHPDVLCRYDCTGISCCGIIFIYFFRLQDEVEEVLK